jgi:hypothetical protein
MKEDRPLDSLLPELNAAQPIAGMTTGPRIHPAVLQVELEAGYEWLFSIWAQPEPHEIEHGFRKLLKVSQLVTACDISAPRRRFTGAALALFEMPNRETSRQLSLLGFRPIPYVQEQFLGRMVILKQQAAESGWSIPENPVALWYLPVHQPEAQMRTIIAKMDDVLTGVLEDTPWGESPGAPSKRMAELVRYHFGVEIEPTLEGLKTLDLLLLDHRADGLRWVPPGIFMALCDFIGVVIQHTQNMQVGWALPEPVGEFPPPPVFRLRNPAGLWMLSIGTLLTEWAIMPVAASQTTLLPERLLEVLAEQH